MKIDKKLGTMVLCIFLIIIWSLLFYHTYSFPKEMGAVASRYGSAFFPRILSIFIILCAILLMIQSLLSRKGETSPDIFVLSRAQILRVLSLWICCLLFYVAWTYFGFLLVSCLFMLGVGMLLGVRKIWILAFLISLGPIIFFIFERVLKISLS